MCHRFTMLSSEETQRVRAFLERAAELLAQGAAAGEAAELAQAPRPAVTLERIDCYPGRPCEVIAQTSDGLVTKEMTWGFEVPGRKGLAFNARIESALSGSPLWRNALQQGRCIVPVQAFYETRTSEAAPAQAPIAQPVGAQPKATQREATPRTAKGGQVRFAARAAEALLLAGLCEGERFALVTTEAAGAVQGVHDRMPIALSAAEALTWLQGSPQAAQVAERACMELEATEEPSARRASRADADGQLSLF